jgi:hypothetical protein
MGAREDTCRLPFPTTAPTNAQTDYVIAGPLTGAMLRGLKRIELTLRSSHVSATDGLTFEALYEGDGTTYRQWAHFTHAAATAADPTTTYFVAVPLGVLGVKILYDNSANGLTSWAGSIALDYREQAATS